MKVILLMSVLHLCVGFKVTPFEDKWTQNGRLLSISCRSTEPIQSCTWTTPYGETYALSHGLKTENGRLEYFLEENNFRCGLIINTVEAQDAGDWECSVGVVNQDSEVNHNSAQGTVMMAKTPESIFLLEPFDQGTADISEIWEQKSVSCVVRHANPKPDFSWIIGDEKLTGYDFVDGQNEQTWTQTLKYSPMVEHDNQTLRCVIHHPALDDQDTMEAEVVLKFTNISENYLQKLKEHYESQGTLIMTVSFAVAGTVGGLIVLFVMVACGIIFVESLKGGSGSDQDYSTAENGDDSRSTEEIVAKQPEPEHDHQEENATGETNVKQESRKLKKKLTTIFGMNKKQPGDNGALNQSGNEEYPKIDLDMVEGDIPQDDEIKTNEENPGKITKAFKAFRRGQSQVPIEDRIEKADDIKENDSEENQDAILRASPEKNDDNQ